MVTVFKFDIISLKIKSLPAILSCLCDVKFASSYSRRDHSTSTGLSHPLQHHVDPYIALFGMSIGSCMHPHAPVRKEVIGQSFGQLRDVAGYFG